METKLIGVRIPEQLMEKGEEIVKEEGFRNIQELIVNAFREAILRKKRLHALKWLEANFGITKNQKRKPFTKEIREKIAETSLERAEEITKRYGFEDMGV